ncbi:unnamed protein product [Arctia plantaginis]|uniref:Hemolin n=1 Tax=Arctia plantaginis TaxID=874455 RepID=A0A8S0YU20_ARCPL|nr:unnamed protein product [Arctia plantaginis]
MWIVEGYHGGEDPSTDPGVRFTNEPADVVIAPGDSALLPCSVNARRGLRLQWRHSATGTPTRDHAITDTDKYRRHLPNGSLSIENMSASLAGQYQCVATVDGIGTILSRQATVFLAEVPEVAGGPRSVLGSAGGAALLPCGVRAPPRLALRLHTTAPPDRRVYGAARLHNAPPLLKLNVTWLKNGSPVRIESARMSLTPSGALEIEPLRAHDAARYRCRVALAHSPHTYKTSEETELRVSAETANAESPPRFIATPQPLTVMEGASVTFDCAAVGNPKPEMTWLNNGAAIDLNDLDSRFYLVGSGSLRVQSARSLDAGAYTCRAHNRLDSADYTTQLHVLTAPRVHISEGAVQTARARGDVTLRCDVRGRPTPTVTWLKDGDPLTLNNHDIALVDGTSLRIQGVLRVDAGMFQCAATSAAGSAASALRLVVLPPLDDFSNTTVEAPPSPNTTHDIFTTLVSDHDPVEPTPDDPDFLGETSSAYTSGPDLEYDDNYDDDDDESSLTSYDGDDSSFNKNDLSDKDTNALDTSGVDNDDTILNTGLNDDDDSFHAAKGLDLDLETLKSANASVVSPPRSLKAVIIKHRFVTLSWEEPQHKGEEVTGYAVIYKVKGSERERVARGGASRHETNVASLQPNTTYQFAVIAYTEHGTSPPSEMIEVRTSEEEVSHGPPMNVRVESMGPHALRVTWSPPLQQPAPTKYSIHYTEVESGREQFHWVEAPAQGPISHTLSGLRAACAYSLRVAAAGGAPAELRARTLSDAPAAAPLNVSALATSANSILVRWEAPPTRTHRGPLTGYKVRYRALPSLAASAPPGGGGAVSGSGPPGRRKADSLTTPADQRRAELRPLETATTYQIRVCAINANGSGPFSEWVTASTQRQELDESRVPPPPPALTTRAGRDWISVWWSDEDPTSEVGVVVRGYVLGWGLGVPDDASRELPAHLHSHVIRGLESNSEYVISLRASNSRGLGPAVYATVRTKPPAANEDELDGDDEESEDDDDDENEPPPLIPPVGVKVIMLSGTTAVVYWTDPSLPKGQTATDGRRYVVRWSSAGGRVRTFNATDLNCMLDELRPYTLYEFAVKLIKGGRESSWSMIVSNTTLESAPGSPPRELRPSPAPPPASPARAVDLVWQPPTKPNGVITGYVIMYAVSRGGNNEEWTAIAALGDRTRARVERLRARTTYLFKLQARNSKGLGPFCTPVTYTTAMESGEGGGLASATSAWLWASAGGACAVLALAAALALSLCCRRSTPPLSPDTSTYQKSSASAGIKPPDLWIHHDQMELKHMDKSLHSSAISASSADVGGAALVSSTLTLGRAPPVEYEPARHQAPPPASLDRRHYVPTYVACDVGWAAESRSTSAAGSDDTAPLRSSPAPLAPPAPLPPPAHCRRCDTCDYLAKSSMTGMGVGVGVGGVGCASTCDRRQHARMQHPDQSTPLLSGVAPLGSPQASLASLAPHAHAQHAQHAPCGSGACPLSATCSVVGPAGDIYASSARERGHYVAYEPLGHYTHRDSLSSEPTGAGGTLPTSSSAPGGGPGAGGGPAAAGSLQRRAHLGGHGAPLHSFALDNTSDHSTPTHSHSHSHSRGSVRETSPYKKSASSSPGHIPNRLQLGGNVAHCSEELEPLTPSRSTERLHREMQNLEGLMKDLSAITQQQFHC